MDPSYIHLKMLLGEQPSSPVWPDGVRLRLFDPAKDSRELHSLLAVAYEDGGGSIEPHDQWLLSLLDDEEFDPSLVFLVVSSNELIVAAAQCWAGGFIKDLAVAKAWRKQGLGEALLLHVFRIFRERGLGQVDLKVELNNPSGAERLYRRLGMVAAI